MSRDLTAGAQTAAEASHVRPAILVHLALDDGEVYVCSLDRNVVYDGNTYLGVGALGTISAIEEKGSLQACGIKLTMSGIPSDYVSMVLVQPYQGRPLTIYYGFLDATYTLIADPILQWAGTIDQMALSLGETATISISAESRLIRWETPVVRRYTDADQQAMFPGDLGLQFVSQTVEREILWGHVRARQ